MTLLTAIGLSDIAFFIFALLIIGCGAVVAFSRNIVHSGFALMGTFAGVAGLYALAFAQFIAAVQIMVYVGGVLVVILFAIMMTREIGRAESSNPAVGRFPAVLLGVVIGAVLVFIALQFPWTINPSTDFDPTVNDLGDALLSRFLIPFEVLSLLLLAVLVGAVMLVKKEIKALPPEEKSS
ncbi:MAG: NADH-quinone oxidoreductase subunit J [Acidobacteria bacterium]|nr:NADH-quinone oxidoreductase subunit J [Acidobacteriota bacterium]